MCAQNCKKHLEVQNHPMINRPKRDQSLITRVDPRLKTGLKSYTIGLLWWHCVSRSLFTISLLCDFTDG
jgi:hypothetical protein